METIEDNLRLLMEGKPYEEMYEFCDYSLVDQNDAAAAKGVQPSAPSDYLPVIQKSVTYIVAAVIINEHGEVLMMQVSERFPDFCREKIIRYISFGLICMAVIKSVHGWP